ncbi:LOW QUALITY PROTEIN: hypothetical protein PHMEG_00037734 [Phytophthora megakarya]|uniref:Uncharacterized protein n=1 Tax=Phytophthora megakarya TaxID=4795 RepID=A0A225UIH2_9STRA|nr:LOW QUALITY PROTEIN: hypothetical protein PHMEG_00037734 [Phytophthora megakarya]
MAFVTNNYMKPGRRGARVLREIRRSLHSYSHRHISHAAVLTVQGNIYDKNKGKPISSARRWINFYAFIRPLMVFK